jgi:CRISPR-associated endoribonuclease Cas6
MLINSTWVLTVDEPSILPRSYGIELVKMLHQNMQLEIGGEQKPTTVFAGILGYHRTSQNFLTFYPDEFYQLHLSGLQESSSKAIASLELPETLEFLGARFKVINRSDTITSYEELYHTLVASEPDPAYRLQLKFQTPTSFSQGRTHLPLPVPSLMFRSWLDRWNEFAPVYLGGDELANYLGVYAALSYHRIQTQPYLIYQGRMIGFTGNISLSILRSADPLLVNVAHLLARYAHFCGTGIKTRLGMGHTVLKRNESTESNEDTRGL